MPDNGTGDQDEEEDEDALMDYEQMDLRICGDLSKLLVLIFLFCLVEKNKKLDEFYLS